MHLLAIKKKTEETFCTVIFPLHPKWLTEVEKASLLLDELM